MKKKGKILGVILAIIFIGCISCFIYQYVRVKNAKVEVELVKSRKVEFRKKVKVSDFLKRINGKLKKDFVIDTTKLGKQRIVFEFVNDDHILVSSQFTIEVVDTVKPVVWLNGRYRVKKGEEIDFASEILCGDNYDNHPKCQVEGEYDLESVGDYSLVFTAEDQSGNREEKAFILSVYEENTELDSSKNTTDVEEADYTLFSDVVEMYKNKNTKIGIDVSKWQGDIDFKKLKEAGVEFVMIRLGGTRGNHGEYFIDEKFEQNMKMAKKYQIPVGIYFYSYASSIHDAKEEAQWVVKQIKNYSIDFPIAFDWEEWKNFNQYHLSFFGLTSMAEEFLNVVKKKGYQGMLYSSKAYLENIWLKSDVDIWLAHYTMQTDYQDKFRMWQLCNNGRVAGIDGNVDIDVFYEN